jgi:hypothetical protein
VGWASTAEIAQVLLQHGAVLDGEELEMPTRKNWVEVVDLLLKYKSPLNESDPQYLNAHSKEMLDVYRKHGIIITGCDRRGSNLLHKYAWKNDTDLFDYAFQLGVQWEKDVSRRTPYALAKQGRRVNMVTHLRKNYLQFTTYTLTELELTVSDPSKIIWMRRVSRHKDLFVALTEDGELLQFLLRDEELTLVKRVAMNVNFIRNFSFDQWDNLIVPTGDDELLAIAPHSLEINQRIGLEPDSGFEQITYLPAHGVFLATGNDWSVYTLDKAYRRISKESMSDGIFFIIAGKSEELLSLYSYDQECYHKLYAMDAQQQLREIMMFSDYAKTTGYDLAIDAHEVFVASVPVVRAFRLVNGTLEQKWEVRLTAGNEATHFSAIALLSSHVLAVGWGENICLLSRETGAVISQPAVQISGAIKELIADVPTGKLIIRTDKALHVVEVSQKPE